MANIGYGCDLQYSANAGGSWTSLAAVEDFNFPNLKATDVRISNIQMAQAWHDWQPGLGDGGVLKFKIIFAKALFATIYSLFRIKQQVAGTDLQYRIVFSDINVTASTFTMVGYINAIDGLGPLDDKITCDIGIKVCRQPTFVAGT
jgi:hypothetical protein